MLMRAVSVALVVLLAASPAAAWNATGHRIIAAIAYDNLTPIARARVDALIRLHPDYAATFAAGAPGDARAAFIATSYWPDLIRNDPRFYDDTRRDASPTGDNDIFKPMGVRFTRRYEFMIFDRWGGMVYETNNPNDGWDGKVGGEPAPIGTYIYSINYIDISGQRKVFKGVVNLLR
jgi:gliding motility-associated-like protein